MTPEPAAALPWDAIRHAEEAIPWDALDRFADALAANPALWEELREAYDVAVADWFDRGTFECYCISAIFALAAPRLDDAARATIGRFLVDELVVAADDDEEDDDGLIEVLSAASGSMGPPVVPAVLDALDRRRRYHHAWFYLWGLTLLAPASPDAAVRERAAACALRALRDAERRSDSSLVASAPARTLAKLGRTDALPLMRRIQERDPSPDMEEAIDILEGKPDPCENKELWDEPVRTWLPSRWDRLRKWYEIPDEEDDDEDDRGDGGGEDAEDKAAEQAEELIEEFLDSPLAEALPEAARDHAGAIADWLLYYAYNYCDAAPEQLDEVVLGEVLLELFPRKVSAQLNTFRQVVPVLQAFLRWLASRGILPDGERLAHLIGPWHKRLLAAAANPANWGMAKSLVMQARSEGVDVEDPDEFQKFCLRYNERVLAQRQQEAEPEGYFFGDDAEADAIPQPELKPETIHVQPSVGRNDPCPCGSGKKFKKCCAKKGAEG